MSENALFNQWTGAGEHPIEYAMAGLVVTLTDDIARIMEEQNLDREQLAERMGVSRQFVTRLLNGTSNLTLEMLLRLARALDHDLRISFHHPLH